ncbi:MAG: signal peptidase I [Lachnospiraceae bacterium]|nr:signal peptidase I [Lachnospiraceae bacterium]
MRQKKTKKKSIWKELLSWIIYLAVLFGAIYLIVQYVGERTIVSGDSMYPSLSDGDSLIVDKISYRFVNPDRYDVVVFPFRYQEGTFYIKRVIGLPGETVQILDGKVYINGKALDDPYGYETIRNPGLASGAITLKQDEYFVLGDNRNNSADSREPSVGMISREDIIGRAIFRIWPAGSIGFLAS